MDLRIGETAATKLEQPGRILGNDRPDAAEGAKSFGDFLTDAIGEVESANKTAQALGTAFALGEPVEVHDVTLAFAKAELSLRLFLGLRNKIIEAYQEIMRMPV